MADHRQTAHKYAPSHSSGEGLGHECLAPGASETPQLPLRRAPSMERCELGRAHRIRLRPSAASVPSVIACPVARETAVLSSRAAPDHRPAQLHMVASDCYAVGPGTRQPRWAEGGNHPCRTPCRWALEPRGLGTWLVGTLRHQQSNYPYRQ